MDVRNVLWAKRLIAWSAMGRIMLRRARRGFTLIELLVVIAIIAILAAILFPVFAQAKEKGKQTQCISNMKQFSLGMMMYIQDYDDNFQSQGTLDIMDDLWMWTLVPYIKGAPKNWNSPRGNIYYCPSNPNVQRVSNTPILQARVAMGWDIPQIYGLIQRPDGSWAWHNSYCLNDAIIGETGLEFTNATSWGRPSDEYMFMETTFDTDMDSNDVDLEDNEVFMKHTNGMNVAYVDGHAKWMKDSRVPNDSSIHNGKGKPVYYNDSQTAFSPWRPVYQN